MDGKQHFCDVAQVVSGFIEQAVSQPGSYENPKEAVYEQRAENLVRDFLVFLKFPHVVKSEQ